MIEKKEEKPSSYWKQSRSVQEVIREKERDKAQQEIERVIKEEGKISSYWRQS